MKYDYNTIPHMTCGNDLFTSLLYHTHRHINLFLWVLFAKLLPISLCALVPQSNGVVGLLTLMYLRLSHLWIFRADLNSMLSKLLHILRAFKTER